MEGVRSYCRTVKKNLWKARIELGLPWRERPSLKAQGHFPACRSVPGGSGFLGFLGGMRPTELPTQVLTCDGNLCGSLRLQHTEFTSPHYS